MPVRKIAALDGAVQPVSLEEAKQQCRATDCVDEDGLISIYVGAATSDAGSRMQRALVPSRYRLTLDAFTPAIELLMPPILDVESVKFFDANGDLQTVDPQDYLVDKVSEPGRLVPAPDRRWPITQGRANAVEVTYTAGYPDSEVPKPIKSWILLATADLYEQRTRSAEKPALPQGFADALLAPYCIFSI